MKSQYPNHYLILNFLLLLIGCSVSGGTDTNDYKSREEVILMLQQDAESTSIFRKNADRPLLSQNAKEHIRPYIHPIIAPDGQGEVTEYSPGHHKHQTGLYWGFTQVNGRDFFHNPGEGYWRKVAANAISKQGEEVQWQIVYELLDEAGQVLLLETQTWTMGERDGKYFLDLDWKGEAKTDITIGKYDYGGLFLRMPWKKEIKGEVINAARQKNDKAEGQPAMWVN